MNRAWLMVTFVAYRRQGAIQCKMGHFFWREAAMRKATLALLVVVAMWGATSWQITNKPQPQWRVVQSVILEHQTNQVPPTTIFTPDRPGLYRMSGYMTGFAQQAPPQNDFISFTFACSDLSPAGYCGTGFGITYNGVPFYNTAQQAYLFSPRPGTPVSYEVTQPPANVEYTLAFTVEQLQ
jgi:hypothetical protein